MYVLRPKSMAKSDQETIDAGFPEILLMEAAARGTAELADKIIKHNFFYQANYYKNSAELDKEDINILIFVGKGNNGGDGLAAARFLANWGYKPEIILSSSESELRDINQKNYELALYNKIKCSSYDNLTKTELEAKLKKAELIIDALLGTGIKGEVRGNAEEIIALINDLKQKKAVVLAVDIPSGINGLNGSVLGRAIKADHTAVMAAYKRGLLLFPGADYAGKVKIIDIGIKESVLAKNSEGVQLMTQNKAKEFLPQRKRDGHKGTFGRAAFLAGSRGMDGAPLLSADAALRSGSGLVYLLLAEEIERAAFKLREVLTKSLPSKNGIISEKAVKSILDFAQKLDVLAVGPGLGLNNASKKVIKEILENLAVPLVMDADALNSISDLELLKKYQGEILLTPHPGEMARLIDLSPAQINQNKIEIAQEFAIKYQLNLILKGALTVIAAADGRIYLNNTGTNGMATAGSGDVLTGIVSALIGQGMAPFEAAALAVYVHGRAGEKASLAKSDFGLKSGDLIEYLTEVWKTLT
ncbi:MAG: NAD(P)H-hydrate dehydratase [Halanaerobium sp. MSAO_Bac5]|nr:MAG: NAD(P)H-hydrate dehydratase [Halanaerobium sp. MSAO_Bac5]